MTRIIDEAQTRHIAELARLDLPAEELAGLTGDLERILEYVRQLSELDTSGVEPTTHATDLPTHLRADEARPGLPVDVGLADAPERIGDGFGVPKIIE